MWLLGRPQKSGVCEHISGEEVEVLDIDIEEAIEQRSSLRICCGEGADKVEISYRGHENLEYGNTLLRKRREIGYMDFGETK